MKPTSKSLATADWPEWRLIRGEHELLPAIMEAARKSSETHLTTLFPLLDALACSTETLMELCERHNLRDGYVVARVIYETAINACFILAGGIRVAERAWRHARQKSLRDLDRTIELAGKEAVKVRWSGADAAFADPANQKLLEEFTSRSGREISLWTPENVRERLETITRSFGDEDTRGLVFGLLLYRHASEIAHGTLYGALFSLGAAEPNGHPKTVEELGAFRADQCRLLLMLVGFTLESLVIITSGPLQVVEAATSARTILKAFSNRPRDAA